jgi:hypothetical protein
MLLNLSNHPYTSWPVAQATAALRQFGTVQDLPFPSIPPQATTAEVQELVEDYYQQIRQTNPHTVHLMGEMTFTFALVQRLQAAGIPCVASTSERIVEEREGRKIVTFNFVQFRPYAYAAK